MTLPDRRTLVAWLVVAVAGIILIGGQSRGSRLSADFTIDYSAGTLLREGRLSAPYDQRQLAAVMERIAPHGAIDPRLPFNKPLAAALPAAVLSLLPLDVAFRIWQAVCAGLLLLTLLVLQRHVRLGPRALEVGAIGLVAALPTADTFDEGQVTPLLALGAALMVASLQSKRPWLAAGAGGLLAIKPQYLPAYLILCFAARNWKALSAAAAGAGFILMSPLVGGAGSLVAMAEQMLGHASDLRFDEGWIGDVIPLLPPTAVVVAAITVFLAAHLALAIQAWRRPSPSLLAFGALAGAIGALASPHALPHDLLILAVPAWLAVALYRGGRLPNPLPLLVATDLALVVDLVSNAPPLAPIVMTLGVIWMMVGFRQRSSRLAPPIGRAA